MENKQIIENTKMLLEYIRPVGMREGFLNTSKLQPIFFFFFFFLKVSTFNWSLNMPSSTKWPLIMGDLYLRNGGHNFHVDALPKKIKPLV